MGFFKIGEVSKIPYKLFEVMKENPVCPIQKESNVSCECCMYPLCGNPVSKYNMLRIEQEKYEGEDE